MKTIDGQLFKEMLRSGLNNLGNNQARIDSLNVFPVPDGDTGTNMYLTFSNGVNEALACDSDSVGRIAKVLSRGLLLGARGNSGVITSQIFRGFYQSVEDLKTLNALELARAFVSGSRVAYRAVMRPVEGTILTVIREAADYTLAYTEEQKIEDCTKVMKKMVEECEISLDFTPKYLPVLAEVGVVDSGGAGLVEIFQGFLKAMEGHPVEKEAGSEAEIASQAKLESDEFGFCTEFILSLSEQGIKHFSETGFKEELATIGNSIVCVQDDDLVKVHVHTLEPAVALKMGKRQGQIIKLKVENMSDQHEEILLQEMEGEVEVNEPKKEHQRYAIITVANGEGLKDYFKELRADEVITGGQTMNPSAQDFMKAIENLDADDIFILPNNSNIILAANQAADIAEHGAIHVLPTKSIPQGLAAITMFNPQAELEENLSEMQAALEHVKTGEVTHAVKDTTYEGTPIKAGDYMAISGKSIVSTQSDLMNTAKELLQNLLDEESEVVTLLYGEDVKEETAKELEDFIEENSDAEVELINGKQPLYPFIIGVE